MDEVIVDVQPTPNVNALKFTVNRHLTEGRSRTFRSRADAVGVAVAERLFDVPGIVQVFLLNDFITVTRDPSTGWDAIVPEAERILRETL